MEVFVYKLSGWIGGVMLKAYAKRRRGVVDPVAVQEQQLLALVDRAQETTFGVDHDFASIRSVSDYQERVPIRTYEAFWKDYWSIPFPVLDDVSWPGRIRYFARSSGTTTGESKHIPCSDEMVKSNNRAGVEVLLHHLRSRPHSTVSSGRTFLFGGSPNLDELATGIFAGELSGIAAKETLWWAGRDRYYPPADLAAISDWSEKVERLATDCVGKDIRSISGVPTWLQILFDRAFDAAGVKDRRLVELFPDLELITHGGVSFEPYEQTFTELLRGSRAELREVYAASEGFVAVADRQYRQGMQMLLDNGLFFEFVEVDQLDQANPERRWIADVEPNTNYALILSTNAGLWSYAVGDIVRLVDLDPPRLLVAGRVSQTLSTFGEHVSGEQLEIAVAAAAKRADTTVADFAVAPIITPTTDAIGHHRYVIEATSGQAAEMATTIDASLSEQNADYRSKRAGDVAIAPPVVTTVPTGTFAAWMAARGRAGGQNKVPRVTTDTQLADIETYTP